MLPAFSFSLSKFLFALRKFTFVILAQTSREGGLNNGSLSLASEILIGGSLALMK